MTLSKSVDEWYMDKDCNFKHNLPVIKLIALRVYKVYLQRCKTTQNNKESTKSHILYSMDLLYSNGSVHLSIPSSSL